MDDFLRDLISRKWKIKGLSFTFLDLLLTVCITGTGLALRSTVIAHTPTNTWKLCGIFLEYALAVLAGAIVHSYTGSRLRSLVTYGILVIYPTIVANGSLWNINCIYYVILFFLGLYLYSRGHALLGSGSILAGLLIALFRMRSWWKSLGGVYPTSLNRGWPNFYEIIGKRAFVDTFDKVSILILLGLLLTGLYWFAEKRSSLQGIWCCAASFSWQSWCPTLHPICRPGRAIRRISPHFFILCGGRSAFTCRCCI